MTHAKMSSPTLALRHRIMANVWPLVEHDLAGPLSVMRMQLAVAKQRMRKSQSDPMAILERLEKLESHIAQSAAAIRRLGAWRVGQLGAIDLIDTLRYCTHLSIDVMRPDHFTVDFSPDQDTSLRLHGCADPHHVLLGVLLYFRGSHPDRFRLRIELLDTEEARLGFHVEPLPHDEQDTADVADANAQRIGNAEDAGVDQADLSEMLTELGWCYEWRDASLLLAPPPDTLPGGARGLEVLA